MSSVFEAVSEQTRRRILQTLHDAGAELSVSELVDQLEVSQPTVSKHLKVLRDHDLVEVREEGQRRLYRINVEALGPVREWVDEFFPEPEPTGLATVTVGATGSGEAASPCPHDAAQFKGDDPLAARLGTTEHPIERGVAQTVGQVAAAVAWPFIAGARRLGRAFGRR
ncbi:ArsR/SmtB family transcription factor [Pseudoclavibacter sp. 13-3]|uniref:ArsR/SmtB family transcription factor n=1 Tax=Pseudoclavibacter sp. 13-3 TaxID=2901228 RepID=UPI001E392A3C|nr:metalloregulator ArsR/SmtB family transcription factor [Pseudoclavibacter sp. 13-3]MCD7101653.1 metalloregulator ArsR/SmtB family transcription factor [Pseudoclavibacter sp. 13-3]